MPTIPQVSTADLLTAAGVVIGVVGGLTRWFSTRYRSALKDDLEILKRYGELRHVRDPHDDVHYEALRTQIERTMHNAYNRPRADWQTASWAFLSRCLASRACTPNDRSRGLASSLA